MVQVHGLNVVKALHEPSSAAAPAASCGGVSPPARTPGGTPGEPADEDVCATSAVQFMAPMRNFRIVEAAALSDQFQSWES